MNLICLIKFSLIHSDMHVPNSKAGDMTRMGEVSDFWMELLLCEQTAFKRDLRDGITKRRDNCINSLGAFVLNHAHTAFRVLDDVSLDVITFDDSQRHSS